MLKPVSYLSAVVLLSLSIAGCEPQHPDDTSGEAFQFITYAKLTYKDGVRVSPEDYRSFLPGAHVTFSFESLGKVACADGTVGQGTSHYDYSTNFITDYPGYETGYTDITAWKHYGSYSDLERSCVAKGPGMFNIDRIQDFTMRIQMTPTGPRCSHLCLATDTDCLDTCKSAEYLFGVVTLNDSELQTFNDGLALDIERKLLISKFVVDSFHTPDGDFVGSAKSPE